MHKIVAILFATALTILPLDTSIARSGGGSFSSANRTVHVTGYTRRDGTYVNSYFRAAPGQAVHPSGGTPGLPTAWTVRQPGQVSNGAEASATRPEVQPAAQPAEQPEGYFVRDNYRGKRIFVPPGYGPPMGGPPNPNAPARSQLDLVLRYIGPYDPQPPGNR
jgi:hypothetical protein